MTLPARRCALALGLPQTSCMSLLLANKYVLGCHLSVNKISSYSSKVAAKKNIFI